MSAVISFAKSLGIASSDIATTQYDLSPNYPMTVMSYPMVPATNITNPNTILGYTLTQTVEVKVRDFTNIAKLISGLPPLGVNQIGGVTFTFDKPEKFLAIARADAITQAKAKAAEMAGESGVSLGAVLSVQEYGNVPIYANYAPKAMAMGAESSVSIGATIQPGTQDITDQVTISYELK